MDPHEIERYAEAVFRFCRKRLSNIEDARDLSQEILLEAFITMRSSRIDHFEGWLWKLARNRYARFIARRKHTAVILNEEPPQEPGAEQQAVFEALHSLAQSHRGIMVDHYVHGLSCMQIAHARGLKVETVRTRLYYGREKLRERWQLQMENNRIYTAALWRPSGSGDVDPSLMNRQIVRALLEACYDKPQTLEEISLATGVPCLYLEDEIPSLVKSGLLQKQGKQYLTSIILHQPDFEQQAENLFRRRLPSAVSAVRSALEGLLPAVRAIGFHGCGLPAERLGNVLVPMLMREAFAQIRSGGALERGPLPLRPDGSQGWLCAYRNAEAHKRYFSGVNAYYRAGSVFRHYWSDDESSLHLASLLQRLENAHLTAEPPFVNDEILLAECIEQGLISRPEARWNIPVLTAQESALLTGVIQQAAQEASSVLKSAVTELHELMKAEIPVRLHDQIRGIIGIELGTLIAMVIEQLQNVLVSDAAAQVLLILPDPRHASPA